nr:unnamed protein product [Callosobruchus analis]
MRCLCTDDDRDREQRKHTDKLAAIRPVLELFISNFQKHYVPISQQNMAQYIKNAYTSNLKVYCGKQPPGAYYVEYTAKDIALRLVEPIEGTGRNVTGDNWFSSVPLVRTLLQEKKLTYVGTVRRNKAEIAKEFLPNKERQICSSVFGFLEDFSLVLYCPKKNKCILVISSLHIDRRLDEE